MILPPPSLQDMQLEANIQLAWKAMVSAAHADAQRAAFSVMRDMIAARSPQQIERLERARGLRA